MSGGLSPFPGNPRSLKEDIFYKLKEEAVPMHEWALLIFTICLQAAIGGVVMLALFYKKISALGEEKTYQIFKLPLIVFASLSVIGLAASFAHLGTPLNALNTIRNFGSSWMSREIVFTGLFIAAVFVTLALALAKKRVSLGPLAATALIGLADIFCMAAIYTNSLVSGWSSIHTYTSFYGTALVLGPVLAASLVIPGLRASAETSLAGDVVKYSFNMLLAGIAVQLIGLAVFATSLPEVHIIQGVNALAILAGYKGTVAARWLIELAGVGIFAYLAYSVDKKMQPAVVYAALLAVLAAEGMSRYLFYVLGA